MKTYCTALVLIFSTLIGFSQGLNQKVSQLPIAKDDYVNGVKNDWLVDKINIPSGVFRNEKGNELILSNGLISRSFRITPNATTISLKKLYNQEELIRAVKPEAIVSLDGFTINVGGLTGQDNLAFLYPDWIDELKADPLSFKFTGFKIGAPKKRFEWKEVRHHAPDTEWPPRGVKLQMDYQLNDISSEELISISEESNIGRQEIYHDDFTNMSDVWKIRTSPAYERSSFFNEGKPGEIYTPNNTAVFAEFSLLFFTTDHRGHKENKPSVFLMYSVAKF